MNRLFKVLLVICSQPLLFDCGLRAASPQIVSVRKIWDHGRHNAFTDLIRFQDCWWVTFREAEKHGAARTVGSGFARSQIVDHA